MVLPAFNINSNSHPNNLLRIAGVIVAKTVVATLPTPSAPFFDNSIPAFFSAPAANFSIPCSIVCPGLATVFKKLLSVTLAEVLVATLLEPDVTSTRPVADCTTSLIPNAIKTPPVRNSGNAVDIAA